MNPEDGDVLVSNAYTSEGGGICITWYGNLTDTRVFSNGGLDLYVRVDAVELANVFVVMLLREPELTLFGTAGFYVFAVRGGVYKGFLVVVLELQLVLNPFWYGISDHGSLFGTTLGVAFSSLLVISFVSFRATNKFCDANKIGEGGFGPIYKGLLSTGKEIAVKRLSTTSKQGLNEFKSEMTLIAKLQYRNLVMLLGCCIHGEERMLIYEYMPNGSLDSLIFGVENTISKSLTWRRRLDIIVGIAQGVLYLHRDSRLRIIHRDLKASNVLLDCGMNPKISDFGLARTFGGDQSSATTRVVGTYGYMSPEYVIDGLFSIKSDVFSFGVMILEILSGKSNRRFHHPDHNFNLLGHAWKLWIEGKAFELLDPLVEGSFSMSEVLRDLKASNVLLDCGMNLKISNFGLATAFGGDQSSPRRRRVVGTQ
ncbi:hypothetical protein TEA_017507 [Camellia sinensis var. sinensis]|uniref:non-specific serine/threonine protein kinase n=1 Tax=Camellia sinensis var. sinensis TaxID=542762 RepID=A0A4S4E7E4_CAMSN|nr:hypothetical protein TEA_017507 [Camellia sinensis var. sinensis]